MSYERTEKIMGENKSILLVAGMLFQNISVKVKKTDVAAFLTNGKLKAGTPLTKDGKVVDGTTITADKAFGLLYRDIDLTYSNGNETVPVTIFGFVNSKLLPETVTADVKAALKMIQVL
ncbi:hypothetical protein [Clostridium butyricum]|uniref:hypothetical protein n=1 Tax=Clostridium butyricum TaxID=1492 RepID=UPI00040A59C2|nr:hypothetical protein [Clostridium butyricum]MDU1340231.1 hypothetical protein [Clostridium butyricum]DAV13363.1 MAG TPA: Head decoration protein [Caudoviricetes sp.]